MSRAMNATHRCGPQIRRESCEPRGGETLQSNLSHALQGVRLPYPAIAVSMSRTQYDVPYGIASSLKL